MVDEAVVEHATLKNVMAKLQGKSADDELFTAYVTVLKEYVKHHVTEEENEHFPRVRPAGLDLQGVADRIQRPQTSFLAHPPPRVTAYTASIPPPTPSPLSTHHPTARGCTLTPP